MKFLVLASALLAGASVHARIVDFSCNGYDDGIRISVTGEYEVEGYGQNADYTATSTLSVTGDDLMGNATNADGSDENGERHFDASQVQVRPESGGLVLINAQSPHSHVSIWHVDGHTRNKIEIDFARTYSPSRPPYSHTFMGTCRF